MSDCLASTGAEPLVPLLVSGLLLVVGVIAVALLRRRRRPATGSDSSAGRGGAAFGLILLLVVALGVASVGASPSAEAAPTVASTATAARPLAAASGCKAGPTGAPTPTATPTTPPEPVILPDQAVSFVSGGVTTFGSYRGPADRSHGVPAAVIIGGTGAVDRNGDGDGLAMQEYAWLADLLSAQGIASIRYDKLGTGETGLGPYAADPAQMLPIDYDTLRIQPARDALSFLAAQPGIDAARLIVVGHSEGGAAALAVASDPGSAPTPAGLALIEPAYTHILDIVGRQYTVQIDAAAAGGAMTTADAATLEAWMNAGIGEIRAGSAPFPDPGPVPLPDATEFTQVIQASILSNIYGSDPAAMVITHAYRTLYGKGYDSADPESVATKITIPTLITCGTKDFNTPCGDGTPGSGVIAVSQAFAPGVARFVVLPNMVHIMRDVGDANVPSFADQITYPFSTQLASEFSTFVARFTTISG